MTHQVATLQKSAVGITTVMRKLEAGLYALSTKQLFWQVCYGSISQRDLWEFVLYPAMALIKHVVALS